MCSAQPTIQAPSKCKYYTRDADEGLVFPLQGIGPISRDIPSSEPVGQLLPRGPAPQEVGTDILLPWTLPGFTATAANSSDHRSRCKGKEKSGDICSSNNFE